mgnify:CR=1 FL=1
MVTIDQAMRGAAKYADNEIIPHLPTGKSIGVGIALALIMDGGKSRILALKDHPAVQMMGVMDDEGTSTSTGSTTPRDRAWTARRSH